MTKCSILTTKKFDASFKKSDRSVQKQVKHWIDIHLVKSNDPKSYGKPLRYDKRGYWRYRIGDYRLIADIEDDKLILILIDIGTEVKSMFNRLNNVYLKYNHIIIDVLFCLIFASFDNISLS